MMKKGREDPVEPIYYLSNVSIERKEGLNLFPTFEEKNEGKYGKYD